ncbi:MAG: DUF3035 domain-containing protein [Pseudomonadota bacterium]
MVRIVLLAALPLALAACANNGLRDIRPPGEGPDEFLIQPAKPLQAPTSYSELPAPTPGGANLTDQSALADGTLAFGGRPEPESAGIPARDGALVQYASRLGVAPNIRAELAVSDADFRRRRGRLTQYRLFPVDRYNEVYRRQTLDADREAIRWRRAGARTPSYAPLE